MQKLFPSVSEAAAAGPAPSDTSEGKQPAAETPEPAAPVVRPFDWPPPEEDLDDWHVFQFGETPASAPRSEPPPTPETPPPAASPSSATASTLKLKPSETPTLKIASPYAEKQLAGHELTDGDLADAALADTAEITNSDATNPQLVAPTPAAVSTRDTEPIVVPLATPTLTLTSAATSLASSGALKESGTAVPMRRIARRARVPASTAAVPTGQPLMSATVDVITRSAQAQAARSTRSPWSWLGRVIVIALALLATGEAAYIATLVLRAPAESTPTAVLLVQSQPAGAEILIDGQSRGRTPFRAELPPGQHMLELRKDRVTRKFPLVLAAGTSASQYVEMRAADADPPSTSTPSAPSPSPRSSASSQPHAESGTAAAVGVAAASIATPPAPAVRPAPSVGWLVVQSTVQLSILRNGEAIGNSDDGRLAIVPGRHELEISNNAAGYREATAIQIVPGQVTTLRPELPQSTLDIEATPTAKVLIDGREMGETPLAQIALTIGPHDILLRHPDFPDRHVATFIKVGTPSRVSVDLATP